MKLIVLLLKLNSFTVMFVSCQTYLLQRTISGTHMSSDGTLMDVTLSQSDGLQRSLQSFHSWEIQTPDVFGGYVSLLNCHLSHSILHKLSQMSTVEEGFLNIVYNSEKINLNNNSTRRQMFLTCLSHTLVVIIWFFSSQQTDRQREGERQ